MTQYADSAIGSAQLAVNFTLVKDKKIDPREKKKGKTKAFNIRSGNPMSDLADGTGKGFGKPLLGQTNFNPKEQKDLCLEKVVSRLSLPPVKAPRWGREYKYEKNSIFKAGMGINDTKNREWFLKMFRQKSVAPQNSGHQGQESKGVPGTCNVGKRKVPDNYIKANRRSSVVFRNEKELQDKNLIDWNRKGIKILMCQMTVKTPDADSDVCEDVSDEYDVYALDNPKKY